ncbi:protein-glutamate methylesterase/protein-glutamine glutaminase [Donghicola tyrosinivorans]|uniref:Protein-glutamate methylesterase/protein-glutamine glutaminase n=1 Tax=Donghicola tyrosinivorans TaxID=1652492 RepID=A0A2T0WIB7_9RHOB|nr:chemotaxis response regulator protein-glutamate methylesterase [Donghicola tyrosinivorans]PRY86458.1 two-component system chemotaxis response regulator CheB [Donghicola tyrosinivorans]
MVSTPIRVLIIDDSAMFRRLLALGIKSDPEFELVGAAANAEQARQFIRIRRPDVISLDLEMPQMDGLTFLKEEISKDPIPTVVVSSTTASGIRVTIDALQAGAVDVLPKPRMTAGDDMLTATSQIRMRLKAARAAHVRNERPRADRRPAATTAAAPAPMPRAAVPSVASNPEYGRWLFAIGASTGGVQALGTLIEQLPADAPGTVIVQHMPSGFTNAFARRLNEQCAIEVREAQHGDVIKQGVVLLAPGGDRHMVLQPMPGGHRVVLHEGAPVCYSRPAVDVLFASVANYAAPRVTAALLTGMGRDGAQGLNMIRRVGGRTFAQDEASSVVFGMPAAAWEIGGAEGLVPIHKMAQTMLDSVGSPPAPLQETNVFSTPLRKGTY